MKKLLTKDGKLIEIGFTLDGELHLSLQPRCSDRLSKKWFENNLPINRIVKRLFASSNCHRLTTDGILKIKQNLLNKQFDGYTWGAPGRINVYVKPV